MCIIVLLARREEAEVPEPAPKSPLPHVVKPREVKKSASRRRVHMSSPDTSFSITHIDDGGAISDFLKREAEAAEELEAEREQRSHTA